MPDAASRDCLVALSIAGSDSGANAGIQADLLSFAANGVYGTTALTCVTAQNPLGVAAVEPLPPPLVAEQIERVIDYYRPQAAKTGMLFSQELIEAVAAALETRPLPALVADPVMVATSGDRLLSIEAIAILKERLLPLATLFTPNLDEAAALLGRRVESADDMADAALALASEIGRPCLLKGGHLEGDNTLRDVLGWPEGKVRIFEQTRIESVDTHGSGCALSSAIAAWLARGHKLEDAVEAGRAYLRKAMERPVRLAGRSFLNLLPWPASKA